MSGQFALFSLDGAILLTSLLVTVLVIRASRATTRPATETDSALPDEIRSESGFTLPRENGPSSTQLEQITVTSSSKALVEALPVLALEEAVAETPQRASRQPFVVIETPSDPLRAINRLRDKLMVNPWYSIPTASALLGIGLLLAYWGQSRLLENTIPAGSYFFWLLGLGTLTILARIALPIAPTVATSIETNQLSALLTKPRLFAGGFAFVASILIWMNGKTRLITDPSWDLVCLWLASIGSLFIVAFGLPRRDALSLLRHKVSNARFDILLGAAVLVAATVPRLYDLTGNPWAMSGDEGTFAITAREAIDGNIRNPFNSGPWGYPTLLFMIQGWLMDLYGVNVGGARLMSALLGVGSMVSIYFLTKHHFGTTTGLFAAALGSSFHFHLFWSRNAQNAAAPMFFVPLALLFLDRGLIGRRRADSLFAGCVIGIGQFFHPGDRIIFPIAVVFAGYALLYPGIRTWSTLRASAATLLPQVIWVTVGAIVAHLPLLAYFSTHREAFSDRTNQVSVFASGWLDREVELTGQSTAHILAIQLKNAAMLPFNTRPGGHFHNAPPFVGWPLVLPVAIGMAFVTILFWQRRNVGLAIGFWAVVAGLALTDGMPQTNRYTAAAPFLVIFAAVGITVVARILIKLIRLPRIPVTIIATAIILSIAYWNLAFTFSEPNRFQVTSDTNTQIANQLAREAEALGEGATVYFSGMPRLSYDGFANIGFIAPQAIGIDISEDDAWTATRQKPEIAGPTLFAFIPARIEELAMIELWFPGGERRDHSLPNGELTYVSYLVNP